MVKQHHRACTFGRFNLLHVGHMALFEQMHSRSDYLSIGLSTGPKNLPFELRREVLDLALMDTGIPYRVHEAAHPFELFDQVRDLGNGDVVASFGTDQYKLGIAASEHYGWAYQSVGRLTSSTSLRVAIDEEDWDLVAKLTVPGTASHLINLRKLELTN